MNLGLLNLQQISIADKKSYPAFKIFKVIQKPNNLKKTSTSSLNSNLEFDSNDQKNLIGFKISDINLNFSKNYPKLMEIYEIVINIVGMDFDSRDWSLCIYPVLKESYYLNNLKNFLILLNYYLILSFIINQEIHTINQKIWLII